MHVGPNPRHNKRKGNSQPFFVFVCAVPVVAVAASFWGFCFLFGVLLLLLLLCAVVVAVVWLLRGVRWMWFVQWFSGSSATLLWVLGCVLLVVVVGWLWFFHGLTQRPRQTTGKGLTS